MARDHRDDSLSYDSFFNDPEETEEILGLAALSPQLAPGALDHHAISTGSRTTLGGSPFLVRRQIPISAPPPPDSIPTSLSPPAPAAGAGSPRRIHSQVQAQPFNVIGPGFDWSSGGPGQSPPAVPLYGGDPASAASSASIFDFALPHQQPQPQHHDPYAAFVLPASIDTSQSSALAFTSWGDSVAGMAMTGNPTLSATTATAGEDPWPADDQDDSVTIATHLADDGLDDDEEAKEASVTRSSSRHKRSKKGYSSSSGPSHSSSSARRSSATGGPASPPSSDKVTRSVSSTSPTSSTATGKPNKQLRSASRTSKNSHHKPAETAEERRSRASHNLVEKQYRNRLNAQFESLLHALPEQVRSGGPDDIDEEGSGPPADMSDRRVSKAEVLDMARRHIKTLERQREAMEMENAELLGRLSRLEQEIGHSNQLTGGARVGRVTLQQQDRRRRPAQGFSALPQGNEPAEEESYE